MVLNVSRAEVLSYAFTPAHVETVIIANGADADTVFHPAVLDVSTVLGHQHIVACERVVLKDGYFVLDTIPIYQIQTYFLAGAGRLASSDESSWWVRVWDDQNAHGSFTWEELAGLMVTRYMPDMSTGEVYDTLAANLHKDGFSLLDRNDALAQVAAGTMTVGLMATLLAFEVSQPQLSGFDLKNGQRQLS